MNRWLRHAYDLGRVIAMGFAAALILTAVAFFFGVVAYYIVNAAVAGWDWAG